MSWHIGIHDVARIAVSSDGRPLYAQGDMHWWQTVRLYNREGQEIGEITLHLTGAHVALPVGEQPPYWGIDPRQPSALALIDGESPF